MNFFLRPEHEYTEDQKEIPIKEHESESNDIPRKCCPDFHPQIKEKNMYGMLLESVQHYIQLAHGDEAWLAILEDADLKNVVFQTHKRYPDSYIPKLAQACASVVNEKSADEYLVLFGQFFVDYCRHYGHAKILRVSGRHYRDFLHGIDNLHETMRFSYPKMLSPSFHVDQEDAHGCILHYHSRRIGYSGYVMGQLKQCAKRFYDISVRTKIVKETKNDHGCYVTFRLDFDNHAFVVKSRNIRVRQATCLPTVNCQTFFKLFPFCVVFNPDLKIIKVGSTIAQLYSTTMVGERFTNCFRIIRPLIEFKYENVLSMQKVIFELQAKMVVHDNHHNSESDDSVEGCSRPYWKSCVLLKGQMKHLPELNAVAFLCTPLLSSLEELKRIGLFINDLNMYDGSRSMVMAGWQHASRLELLIEKHQQNSEEISKNLKELDKWRAKSDALLHSMIPKSVAIKLKNGEDPISTCQVLENVTLLFAYVIGFKDLCGVMEAIDLVKCITRVFQLLDQITVKYNVFKVETVGDALYMVAGGVPEPNPNHALHVADMALELIQKSCDIERVTGNAVEIGLRIGIHTGPVVSGIVGQRMPQYCLFGDTVNTASRMQSYSLPGKIHISESSNSCLVNSPFTTVFRGDLDIKGKGKMATYWLTGKEDEDGKSVTFKSQPCCSCGELTQPYMTSMVEGIQHGYNSSSDLKSVQQICELSQQIYTVDNIVESCKKCQNRNISKRKTCDAQKMNTDSITKCSSISEKSDTESPLVDSPEATFSHSNTIKIHLNSEESSTCTTNSSDSSSMTSDVFDPQPMTAAKVCKVSVEDIRICPLDGICPLDNSFAEETRDLEIFSEGSENTSMNNFYEGATFDKKTVRKSITEKELELFYNDAHHSSFTPLNQGQLDTSRSGTTYSSIGHVHMSATSSTSSLNDLDKATTTGCSMCPKKNTALFLRSLFAAITCTKKQSVDETTCPMPVQQSHYVYDGNISD